MTEENETITIQPEPEQKPEPEKNQQPDSGQDLFESLGLNDMAQDDKEKEPEPEIPTKKIVSGAFATTFGLLAPAWNMSKPECDALGEAWAPIVDKYLPGFLNSIFGAAIMTTVVVIGPKLGKPTRVKKPQPAQQQSPGQNREVQQAKPVQQQSDGGKSAYGY